MPRINANRDSVDDRFSVLGFTVRTESPLYEIAVATDPSLFRADARARRVRRNFFSSRAQGALRARRGEAVYLLPQDVLANFVGSPRLYFGLATYREGTTAKPDFVQIPGEGNMYVGLGGLTERGLRRAVSAMTPSSYGTTPGHDPSLEWGGDAMPQAASAPAPSAAGGTPAPRANGAATTAPASGTAAAASLDYDDGFGAFPAPGAAASPSAPDKRGDTPVQAQEVLLRAYDGDLASQLRLFAETVQWVAGVGDTTRFPHSAICQVEIYAGDRPLGRATAFYIGRRLLLTNAHVVHGADRLVVIPGKNGAGRSHAEEPFGRFTCTQWHAHERYVLHNHDFDMAVVHATQDAPGGRWLSPIEELRQSRPEGVGVCGYSAESRRPDLAGAIVNATLDPDKQHVHRGFVRTLQDERFQYDVQELAGSSGSPVYWIEAGTPPRAHVVGINAGPASAVTNEGCRLTDAKVAWLRARAAEWHESAAMALDDEPCADGDQRSALVQAQEVPLAPATGGRSIGTTALQPGDIILETANAVVSYVIRAGTLSAASHVMLYAGDGRVIEAVGDGVRDVPITEALSHAMLAVAFRHPRMTPEIAQRIVDYARARRSHPYNYAGVAFAGFRILAPFPASVIDGIARRLGREPGQAGAVYCSELVMEAYAQNGVPLTNIDPARGTPQDVVSFATGNLQYVGHLIAEDTGWLGVQLHFPARMLSVDEDGDGTPPSYAQAAADSPAAQVAAREHERGRHPRLAPPPAPVVQQPLGFEQALVAPAVVEIASTIAGAVMERLTTNQGDIECQLDQLRGLKHPLDQPPAHPQPFHDGTPVRLVDWPKVENYLNDEISAGFEIRWQYNGASLGNVQVSNVRTNDAVGWGLKVTARIMDDAIVYPRATPTFAALKVRLEYTFTRVVGSDILAFQEVQLFGNGRFNVHGEWTQDRGLFGANEHAARSGARAAALDAGSGAALPVLSWEAGHPGRAAWTRELVAAIVANKAQLDRGNPDAFIAGYAGLSADLQVKFWAELFVAIAKWESGWNPADSFTESNGEASVGLLALSYTDANSYSLQGVDRAHDTLKDAGVNLRAGVTILCALVARDGMVTGMVGHGDQVAWKGAARYWSTMRTERKHLADIRQRVKDAVGIH